MDKTEVDDSSRVVPCKDWKKGGITRIMYTHSSCPGLTCSLTCTSLGPYIMVHGISFCTCWFYVLFLTIFFYCNTWKCVLCSWSYSGRGKHYYRNCVSLGGKWQSASMHPGKVVLTPNFWYWSFRRFC